MLADDFSIRLEQVQTERAKWKEEKRLGKWLTRNHLYIVRSCVPYAAAMSVTLSFARYIRIASRRSPRSYSRPFGFFFAGRSPAAVFLRARYVGAGTARRAVWYDVRARSFRPLLSAAHISSATRAPMAGVPVVSPTPATMERAKMVFIIWMRSLLVWLARPQQCGAARNARPRALAGLQYTDDSLIYCARLQFFSPFFFSKRSKFRLSSQLF